MLTLFPTKHLTTIVPPMLHLTLATNTAKLSHTQYMNLWCGCEFIGCNMKSCKDQS